MVKLKLNRIPFAKKIYEKYLKDLLFLYYRN